MSKRLPKEIENMLPIAETKSAIEEMISNYDLTGKYLDFLKERTFYSKYFPPKSNFTEFLNEYAQKKCETGNPNPWDKSEPKIESIKLAIQRSILEYLTDKAKLVSENREHLRIEAGRTINYNDCIFHYPYMGNIEFYKDGGWGIGTENGIVLLKNHLMSQPSKIYPLFGDKNSHLRIIQDRDTKKYGVLSLNTFQEVIHCHYDKIVIDSFYDGDGYDAIERHFLKTLKDNKWGCFDDNCALLINCLYHDIRYINGYYEGIRDGDYLTYDKFPDGYDNKYYGSIYVGKKDLYDSNGLLQIGGYDELEFDEDYLLFYWGTSYKRYYVKESNIDGGSIKLSKLKLSYERAQCLVVDKNFVSITKNKGESFRVSKGHVYNSLEDLKTIIPLSILYPYKVSLYLNEGFVYLWHEGAGSFVYTEWEGEFFFHGSGWKDKLIEDDITIIIHYTNEMDEEWRTSVNEVGIIDYELINDRKYFYYRIGSKYGFFSKQGFSYKMFDAIIENVNHDFFVAQIDRNVNPDDAYEKEIDTRILYYKEIANDVYMKLDSIDDIYNSGRLACTIPISFPYTDYTTITNYIYGPFQIPYLNPEEDQIFEEFLAFLRAKDK
jgi:hypothetical protein